MVSTIFTGPLFRDYILPFLLVFVVVFGILEKTKIFGDEKRQINALTGFIIALIAVGFEFPRQVINSLVLYFAVVVVIILIFMILYGFVASTKDGFTPHAWIKWVFGALIIISLTVAVFWATGSMNGAIQFFFYDPVGSMILTNILFVAIIAGAIALMLKKWS